MKITLPLITNKPQNIDSGLNTSLFIYAREVWHAACSPWGYEESDTTELLNNDKGVLSTGVFSKLQQKNTEMNFPQ